MKDKMQYYVLKEKAVPEVLLKVVEAKRLIDSGKIASVQEATESVGISRSSFYKYKDDIFPFHETTKGKTITMVIQMDDEPGLLSGVLKTIADFHANICGIAYCGGLSCKYPYHSSEYTGQWNRNADAQY